MNFLYNTAPGRVLLKLLTRPVFSRIGGWLLSTPPSRCLIGGYVRRNQIDMSRFEEKRYRSFNAFFTRRLAEDAVPPAPPPDALPSPCDGKASAYILEGEGAFTIKRSRYTVGELLDDAALAETYRGGTCLIFRLTPDDYHRYHYVDDGEIRRQRAIAGVLHTVRPLAHSRYPVFVRNARVWTEMETRRFGPVVQIEVGALMVGKIVNHRASGAFSRGEEKGHFAFGGSTVVLLFRAGAVEIREDILRATARGEETVLRMGEVIGARCDCDGERESC